MTFLKGHRLNLFGFFYFFFCLFEDAGGGGACVLFFSVSIRTSSVFFFCTVSALQLRRCSRSVLEMTSRQCKRRISLSDSGFSLLPWQQLPLPARVSLPVFIHFCVYAPEALRSTVFTLPYMGFYEQWAQGFPQS